MYKVPGVRISESLCAEGVLFLHQVVACSIFLFEPFTIGRDLLQGIHS